MIAIIDYDAGNTFNVQKALQHIGLDAVLTACLLYTSRCV